MKKREIVEKLNQHGFLDVIWSLFHFKDHDNSKLEYISGLDKEDSTREEFGIDIPTAEHIVLWLEKRMPKCETCNGNGILDDHTGKADCYNCDGNGRVLSYE